MTGSGPHGSIGMGGMFSVLKVRKGQKPGDYTDPGWFSPPPGTQAWEHQGAPLATHPAPSPSAAPGGVEVQVRKPHDHAH
jgi:manganese oxidase